MLPPDITKGTPIFHPQSDCLDVREWEFCAFVPGGTPPKYVRTTTGHTPTVERCFLTRKEAVQECIKGLKKRIRELERSVEL
jgi:hypothetical protein